MTIPHIPTEHLNVYTAYYTYAKQNLMLYNAIAIKYNLPRLQSPLNIR